MIIYVEEIRKINLELGYKEGTKYHKQLRTIAADLVLSIDEKSHLVFTITPGVHPGW